MFYKNKCLEHAFSRLQIALSQSMCPRQRTNEKPAIAENEKASHEAIPSNGWVAGLGKAAEAGRRGYKVPAGGTCHGGQAHPAAAKSESAVAR